MRFLKFEGYKCSFMVCKTLAGLFNAKIIIIIFLNFILQVVIWFQLFLCNTNNLYIIIWFGSVMFPVL